VPAYLFQDRADAANQLIAALPPDIDSTWLVLGLPRGGMPIAAAIARHFGATLDLLIVRKVGAPGNPELALAAVTGPGEDQMIINKTVQRLCNLSDADISRLAVRPVQEVEARRRMWVRSRNAPELRGRDVLIVDDGAATGTTLEAAVDAARHQGVQSIVVALPVALPGALDNLNAANVRIVCLQQAMDLASVGSTYRDFPQITDQQVSDLLSTYQPEKPYEKG